MGTACEIAGASKPEVLDSVSFLPTLKTDSNKQLKHRYLYWEFYERTFRQAVVMEEWKLIRSDMDDLKNFMTYQMISMRIKILHPSILPWLKD